MCGWIKASYPSQHGQPGRTSKSNPCSSEQLKQPSREKRIQPLPVGPFPLRQKLLKSSLAWDAGGLMEHPVLHSPHWITDSLNFFTEMMLLLQTETRLTLKCLHRHSQKPFCTLLLSVSFMIFLLHSRSLQIWLLMSKCFDGEAQIKMSHKVTFWSHDKKIIC